MRILLLVSTTYQADFISRSQLFFSQVKAFLCKIDGVCIWDVCDMMICYICSLKHYLINQL